MPAYFASDVHLRLDHPERARRFARWVDSLEGSDSLTIVGDLCDFWLASRQLREASERCEGLKALRDFRARGGDLTILPGNHDHWLGRFFHESIGARYIEEPYEVEVYGLRLHISHGHRLVLSRIWKRWMEGASFYYAFSHCPSLVANRLDHLLEGFNNRRRGVDNERLLALFRGFVASRENTDIVIFGHVHQTVDEKLDSTRMIVLGGWHEGTSYLKIDESGANLIIASKAASIPW
ncbi:UDP-2,3-diacylglucosamine diphosphatase [Singulisphaera sp. PoT]|uniref:UDP-2,3-diacylglucosamine diphosphatase n=1 Tax=Singulisphaera sp. PoT TaxID=3411797 RepID=UPI003BF5AEF4